MAEQLPCTQPTCVIDRATDSCCVSCFLLHPGKACQGCATHVAQLMHRLGGAARSEGVRRGGRQPIERIVQPAPSRAGTASSGAMTSRGSTLALWACLRGDQRGMRGCRCLLSPPPAASHALTLLLARLVGASPPACLAKLMTAQPCAALASPNTKFRPAVGRAAELPGSATDTIRHTFTGVRTGLKTDRGHGPASSGWYGVSNAGLEWRPCRFVDRTSMPLSRLACGEQVLIHHPQAGNCAMLLLLLLLPLCRHRRRRCRHLLQEPPGQPLAPLGIVSPGCEHDWLGHCARRQAECLLQRGDQQVERFRWGGVEAEQQDVLHAVRRKLKLRPTPACVDLSQAREALNPPGDPAQQVRCCPEPDTVATAAAWRLRRSRCRWCCKAVRSQSRRLNALSLHHRASLRTPWRRVVHIRTRPVRQCCRSNPRDCQLLPLPLGYECCCPSPKCHPPSQQLAGLGGLGLLPFALRSHRSLTNCTRPCKASLASAGGSCCLQMARCAPLSALLPSYVKGVAVDCCRCPHSLVFISCGWGYWQAQRAAAPQRQPLV